MKILVSRSASSSPTAARRRIGFHRFLSEEMDLVINRRSLISKAAVCRFVTANTILGSSIVDGSARNRAVVVEFHDLAVFSEVASLFAPERTPLISFLFAIDAASGQGFVFKQDPCLSFIEVSRPHDKSTLGPSGTAIEIPMESGNRPPLFFPHPPSPGGGA